MREQFLNDGIENFDFHLSSELESKKLSHEILSGNYSVRKSHRILVEKSKGLCRQIVIPSVRDAIVLQCLSDALYRDIRGKSPTKKAFFEPKEHGFTKSRSGYGTFASWLNFQRELFKFSKNRNFIIVTDIANYYDTISYSHLRNVISSMTGAEECILDMLIYVLSDLLWQPDYTPRVEIGLPQINLDAPRLLAHCFLYELDAYIDSQPDTDFVRYMDDIDVGVDTISKAKQALRSIDLVLQTKQVRLNSGKTLILTRNEALKHFRILDNARLDALQERIDRRIKAGLPLLREKKVVEFRISRGLRKGSFNSGNGDKILKRLIGLASKSSSRISPENIENIIRLRPNVRDSILNYVRAMPLSRSVSKAISSAALSGVLVDDCALVEITNHLVETKVAYNSGQGKYIDAIIDNLDGNNYYGFYCKIWLESKFRTKHHMLITVDKFRSTWVSDEKLGRIIGSLRPLFINSKEFDDYYDQLNRAQNSDAWATYDFLVSLSTELPTFNKMFAALSSPNPSRGTGITHAKFLCLLAALQNTGAPAASKTILKTNNAAAFQDIYYKSIIRSLGL